MGLSDDILYIGVLIASILSGNLIRKVPSFLDGTTAINPRKWASTLLGIVFAYLVSGKHILSVFLLILFNALIYKV